MPADHASSLGCRGLLALLYPTSPYGILDAMLTQTLQWRLESFPTRSFASLMELYEGNYLLMRRLVPSLARPDRLHPSGWVRSCVEYGPDLYLRLLDRSRHTATVLVTHRFSEHGERFEPDLPVRVYADARLAEVWSRQSSRRLPQPLAQRWESNHFLNRWLRYCLSEGHRFVELDGQALDA